MGRLVEAHCHSLPPEDHPRSSSTSITSYYHQKLQHPSAQCFPPSRISSRDSSPLKSSTSLSFSAQRSCYGRVSLWLPTPLHQLSSYSQGPWSPHSSEAICSSFGTEGWIHKLERLWCTTSEARTYRLCTELSGDSAEGELTMLLLDLSMTQGTVGSPV